MRIFLGSNFEKYVESKKIDYRWFADFPFGITKPEHVTDLNRSLPGYPYLMLKLLPIVAPEQWSGPENFLEVVGLFKDERIPTYPIARGFGWTGLARADLKKAENITDMDFASVTCGACHIGRVRLDTGKFKYMDAGANGQFNLPQFRIRQLETLKAALAKGKAKNSTFSDAQAILDTFQDALKLVKPGFFYNNYQFGDRILDAEYEEKQKKLFIENGERAAGSYFRRAQAEVGSFLALLDKNYKEDSFKHFLIGKTGGMADATGVSTSMQFVAQKAAGLSPQPEEVMPPTRGLTDFMVVWDQKNRAAGWNESKTGFSEGGGQWNGNIPIPMYRNMAAQLTLGLGVDTDLRVSVFARNLLSDMPPPPYPFSVDMQKAREGEILFNSHCADCHKPRNGKTYDVGTNLSRTQVVTGPILANAQKNLFAFCNPSTALTMPLSNEVVRPCESYEGVSLVDKSFATILDGKDRPGIQARVLGGVWAQAPYLAGGSVPTLKHLLMPSTRPEVFKKGTLGYDSIHVGFKWELSESEEVEYDTTIFDKNPALGNPTSRRGHDQDIQENGKTYKLNWSQDEEGAMKIVEYLKTL